ncbi:MAG TPA: ATP-binding protein, partial [Polyangiales bacterium]
RQAHKMEAIGRLTSGIAHNFNNLLSVMLSNVELCRKSLPARVSPQLDDIEHATERASELVRQMMVLARQKSGSEMVNLDLTELVERTLRICRNTFQRSITLEVVAEPELPPVRGRAGDIEQVLLNICINARDVLIESRTTSPSIVVHVGRSADDCLHMSVADNGPGIPLELRTHIFEPFFTTKAVGSGTGLGLATAYAIVREHGGRISCYDNPGGGALFSVELPISRGKGRSEPPRAELAPTGDESILVVEDEAMLRRALVGVLREAGFNTLEAADGREALQLLQTRARVDLMVLDRAMPVMSGDELLRELKRQGSALPVLLLTGQPGECEGAAAVLLKPPRSVQLLRTIRTLLDRAAAAKR